MPGTALGSDSLVQNNLPGRLSLNNITDATAGSCIGVTIVADEASRPRQEGAKPLVM